MASSLESADKRWLFTKKQIHDETPSRNVGIAYEKELSYRQQAANFIQDVGQRLKVTQLCINTAITFMHRFYMHHSFTNFPRNALCSACLFLAAKVEEQPRKMEYVIQVAVYCLLRSEVKIDLKNESYNKLFGLMVYYESTLLQTLGFVVAVDHPHTYVVKLCHLVRANKELAQTSYFMASNSLHLTTMCLQHPPSVVACLCIHLASKWSNWEIPVSHEGNPWHHYVDPNVTPELMESLTTEFLHIIDKCPSRLKRMSKDKTEDNLMFGSLEDYEKRSGDNGSSSSTVARPDAKFDDQRKLNDRRPREAAAGSSKDLQGPRPSTPSGAATSSSHHHNQPRRDAQAYKRDFAGVPKLASAIPSGRPDGQVARNRDELSQSMQNRPHHNMKRPREGVNGPTDPMVSQAKKCRESVPPPPDFSKRGGVGEFDALRMGGAKKQPEPLMKMPPLPAPQQKHSMPKPTSSRNPEPSHYAHNPDKAMTTVAEAKRPSVDYALSHIFSPEGGNQEESSVPNDVTFSMEPPADGSPEVPDLIAIIADHYSSPDTRSKELDLTSVQIPEMLPESKIYEMALGACVPIIEAPSVPLTPGKDTSALPVEKLETEMTTLLGESSAVPSPIVPVKVEHKPSIFDPIDDPPCATLPAEVLGSTDRHHKKKKKEKHGKKDKERSKDEKKHKHKKKDKSKERHKSEESSEPSTSAMPAPPTTPLKMSIPKDKLESPLGSLKIKIPKARVKVEEPIAAPPQPPTVLPIKIKISKDLVTECKLSDSDVRKRQDGNSRGRSHKSNGHQDVRKAVDQ